MANLMLGNLQRDLAKLALPAKAKASAWFFKTGPGQYAAGDKFIGVTVPEQRVVAKKYRDLPLSDLEKLLQSEIHEHRLTALIILVLRYQKADANEQKTIHQLYLRNTGFVNNWDLVDTSAGWLVGDYLRDKDHSLLVKLAKSKQLWERRIAMIATQAYINQGEFVDALRIAEILLHDDHDLIQKAVGWMLREVGKRASRAALEGFLAEHYQTMPRTTLRYAIEHFSPQERQRYLKG